MPKSKDYPKGFSPTFPPTFWLPRPEKTVVRYKEVDSVELSTDAYIQENHVGYRISQICGDYVRLIKQEKIEQENLSYKTESKQYNILLSAHEKRLAEWHVLKDKWDKEYKEEQEKHERRLYLKLKNKFEKE